MRARAWQAAWHSEQPAHGRGDALDHIASFGPDDQAVHRASERGRGATAFGRPVPAPVFYGLVVGSVAPLALLALFVPGELGTGGLSSELITVGGVVTFGAPLLVWRRYAGAVAGPGGLYSFVEAAAGKGVARVHGGIWTVSYFLYLPSTVAQVVYQILPDAYPHLGGYRVLLEIAIPVAMVVGLCLFRLTLLSVTAVVAVALVPLGAVLGAVEVTHAGASAAGFGLHVPAALAARRAGTVSLLFVCASLPLYLGGEIRKAKANTARSLPLALGVGAAACTMAAVTIGRVPATLLTGVVPGSTVAAAFSGAVLARLVTIGTAASLLTLVLLEFVALTRLLTAMTPLSPRPAELLVGAAFVTSAVVSLIGPEATYEQLLKPSLVALYLAQLVVFLVYPRFRSLQGRLRAHDVIVAAVASCLMVYGLLTVVAPAALA